MKGPEDGTLEGTSESSFLYVQIALKSPAVSTLLYFSALVSTISPAPNTI